jgi:hypothetical protein
MGSNRKINQTASFHVIHNHPAIGLYITCAADKVKQETNKHQANKCLQDVKESWKSTNKVERITKYEKWPHLFAIGGSN